MRGGGDEGTKGRMVKAQSEELRAQGKKGQKDEETEGRVRDGGTKRLRDEGTWSISLC